MPGEDDQHDIFISPNPQLPVGRFTFDVPVTVVEADGTRHRCAAIAVSGDMQPPARIVPAMILLGEHPVPGKAEAVVAVRLPRAGWAVERIEADSPDTAVAKEGPGADGALNYRVTQRITGLGDQRSAVRFVVRRPDGRLEPAPVTIHYFGERPAGGK